MSNLSGMRPWRFRAIGTRLSQRLAQIPPPEAENSWILRVLVQALVIVGIVATDVAAETHLSLWAVPLSIAGAVWSWYQRRDRNIPVKFLIAIGMLLALAAFFGRIVQQLNDTRLVLAELLINLLILHSFDLPRRKDLGYSIVIGLILLGVAGTVSQTLAFAPFLLLFLVIALPTLLLDYRSRLGLHSPVQPSPQQEKKNSQVQKKFWLPFSVKRLTILLLLILGLGLTIFAFLPRFPGYKLQTFPVSAPSSFQPTGDGRNISNPGYVRSGKISQGSQAKSKQGQNPGELDDTFYYGFNTQINQNLRGQMKPKVVMRVRSQAAGFWRVLAFDRYTGQGWEISRNEQTHTVTRPPWSYLFLLYFIPDLNRYKSVIQSYTIVSELPNLIPALAQPNQLFFPTEKISVDPEDSLRAPAELLPEGLTYTVISQVPFRDRIALGKAQTKYPKLIRDYYLQVPPEIADKVRTLTEEILAKSTSHQIGKEGKVLESVYEKALYLAAYLKQNPAYQLEKDLPFLQNQEDLVEAFLFGYKNSPASQKITGGYPDHFSTVLTIMLRSIGIPARLIGGFGPGQFNPFTGYYVVNNTDAYLMTEVYFPGYGWFAFDPIPGHDLIPPSFEDYEPFSIVKEFWKWIAGWFPTPLTSLLNRFFGAIALFLTWLFALFAQGWVGIFTGLLVMIIFGFIGWLAFQGWQKLLERLWLAKLPPMESIYQQMLKWLTKQGFPKHSAQTPLEYSQQLTQYYPTTLADVIVEISEAYVSWRYGRKDVNLTHLRRRLADLIKRQKKK